MSVKVTEAVRVPAAVGVNVTLRVHWEDGDSKAPQVFVNAKSPELGPASSMLVKVNVAFPTFVNVAVRGALVLPTAWVPTKVMVAVLMEKPAVETGTAAVLPPPAHDTHHKTMARHTAVRIVAWRRP